MVRVAVYTTSAKVASQLQVPTFSDDSNGGATKPTKAQVEEFIMRAEDYIETDTLTSWRALTITDEYHDYFGVVSVPLGTIWNVSRRGTPHVKARHAPLQSFTSGTHKIELWDGSSWVDLALEANSYTEGRGNDYWIDYNAGVIYFAAKRPVIGRNVVKLTYAYGHAVVPLDIEEAATKLAAIDVLMAQDKVMVIPEGGGFAPLPIQKMERWQTKIERILSRHRKIV